MPAVQHERDRIEDSVEEDSVFDEPRIEAATRLLELSTYAERLEIEECRVRTSLDRGHSHDHEGDCDHQEPVKDVSSRQQMVEADQIYRIEIEAIIDDQEYSLAYLKDAGSGSDVVIVD